MGHHLGSLRGNARVVDTQVAQPGLLQSLRLDLIWVAAKISFRLNISGCGRIHWIYN